MFGFLPKIVALLAAAAVAAASDYPCSFSQDVLDCSGAGLTLPPPGYWPQVHELILSDNPIAQVPKNSFSGFPSLTNLTIDNDLLTEFDFGEVVSVTILSLVAKDNQIGTLTPPADGETVENLEHIELSGNILSSLDPDFFSFAPNLHYLDISNNRFIVGAGQPFLNHPKMDTLLFGIGSEVSLDAAVLSGLPALKRVNIREAQITTVTGAFVNNLLLEIVDIRFNNIAHVTSGTFPSEGRLYKLNLEGTPLKRLDTAALNQSMRNGGEISIKNSPLACDCSFEALYWWSLTKNISINTSCSGQADCSFTRRR